MMKKNVNAAAWLDTPTDVFWTERSRQLIKTICRWRELPPDDLNIEDVCRLLHDDALIGKLKMSNVEGVAIAASGYRQLHPSVFASLKFAAISALVECPPSDVGDGSNRNTAPDIFRFSRPVYFLLCVLPFLIVSALYYYNAPAMSWISVGDGRNAFSPKTFGLVLNLKTIYASFFYVFSLGCFLLFGWHTIRLFQISDEDFRPGKWAANVLTMFFILAALIGLLSTDITGNYGCGFAGCPPPF